MGTPCFCHAGLSSIFLQKDSEQVGMTFQKTMSDNIITIYFLDTPPSLRLGGFVLVIGNAFFNSKNYAEVVKAVRKSARGRCASGGKVK